MNEQLPNPFEAAINTTETGIDPFAAVADNFGEAPMKGTTMAANTGSRTVAGNPFGQSAPAPAGIQETARPVTPIIDLGSQPGIPDPFSESEKDGIPAKVISGRILTMPGPNRDDSITGTGKNKETGRNAETGTQAKADVTANPLADTPVVQDNVQKVSIYEKPPIFEYGSVREPVDSSIPTFEDLRIAKADDFPELEDGIRVSWEVTYGKVKKSVPTPKKTNIGEFKKSIETSKEFTDALRKDKDKSPDCIIKPRITAQSKGKRVSLPAYKGVFTSIEDAEDAGKVISIVPGRDGNVYEIRREEMGTFITQIHGCRELSEIKAGFTPALPPIPCEILRQTISFFHSLISDGKKYEAIVNIYWNRKDGLFTAVIPRQRVTAVRAESELSHVYCPEQYLHYMDIHSHNVMPARFSLQDDRDEKATRLYAVIGRLDQPVPEMSVRMSNGGKHFLIDPDTVFQASDDYSTVGWEDQNTQTAAAEKMLQYVIQAFKETVVMCA